MVFSMLLKVIKKAEYQGVKNVLEIILSYHFIVFENTAVGFLEMYVGVFWTRCPERYLVCRTVL